MASLPSNTFICNYNARDYVAATRTLPKTEGQTLNQNLTLGASVTADTENGYLTINNNRVDLNFNSAADNPFNRYNNETGRSLTIIYKTSRFFNSLFGNRGRNDAGTGDNYNYMVRDVIFHTSDSDFLRMTATTSPYIMYVRINADGTSERKCVTTGQIVTASSISYGNAPKNCSFFNGGANITEPFNGDFYWIYVSTETLTDAEIAQVIAYNEPTTFGPDDDSFLASYTGLTTSTTLNAVDLSWSATTVPSWVTVSPSTGSGTTQITITVEPNTAYSARTGSIVFTSSESDTAEIAITQAKYPLFVPVHKMYRGGNEIIKSCRSGDIINREFRNSAITINRVTKSNMPTPDKDKPLTFKILSGGTINWLHNRTLLSDVGDLTIQYRINGGSWINITSSTAGTSFNVSQGDIVELQGDNTRYGSLPLSYTTFSGSTAVFEAYGNIMSLIDSTGYTSGTQVTEQYCFNRLFADTTGLTYARNLVIPSSAIPMHCYTSMFQNCTSLTYGPALPGPTLNNSCYNEMFNGCTNLSTIMCLATDVSAYHCTYNWVTGVAASGTFIIHHSMNDWGTGNSGIPTGWTVVEA